MTDVEKALALAERAHKGQFRKNSSAPYISHPIAVRDMVVEMYENKEFPFLYPNLATFKVYLEIIALLHDLEDAPFDWHDEVKKEFGDIIYDYVLALTHVEGETYLDKVLKAKSNPFSRAVKICDNRHNMSDLKDGSLKDKYRLSEYILWQY